MSHTNYDRSPSIPPKIRPPAEPERPKPRRRRVPSTAMPQITIYIPSKSGRQKTRELIAPIRLSSVDFPCPITPVVLG